MGTRETRQRRGKRQGDAIVRRLVAELRTARVTAGVSQRALAAHVGCSQSEINRIEQLQFTSVPVPRLAEIGSVLGLELNAAFYPSGDPLRDKGHQAVIVRLSGLVASPPYPPYVIAREVLLPGVGDTRSWDLLFRLDDLLVGVEVETRVHDIQACVRRIRARERDGGVDDVLLVLADTAHNRRVVNELREALGPRFATSPRLLIGALRAGRRLPGSGVILV